MNNVNAIRNCVRFYLCGVLAGCYSSIIIVARDLVAGTSSKKLKINDSNIKNDVCLKSGIMSINTYRIL